MVVDLNYFCKVIKRISIVILTLLLIYFSFKLAIFYIPFLIGLMISLIIEPIIKFVGDKLNFTRKTSAILVLITTFIILISLISFGIVTLISESTNFLR